VNEKYLAIINPAAGGGRAGRMFGGVLERLRSAGIAVDVNETAREGHATELTRDGYSRGYRKFISVGGDGTTFEIVNGLFPEAASGDPPSLAFLPLGTGNSFLRDFTDDASSQAVRALIETRSRPCDVFRLRHKTGVIYFLNLFNVGFAADVAMIRHRRFRRFGELGYIFALFVTLARLKRRAFPMTVDGGAEVDRRRSLFLTFNNSKFTGGKMMIAPNAETADGLIEYVRWGPIGRLGLIGNLPGLFTGKHIHHPMAERQGVKRVDFFLEEPVDVALDGEVATLHIEGIDVLPQALRVVI